MTFVLAALAARAPTVPVITATALSTSAISIALTTPSTVPVGNVAFYVLFRSIGGAPFAAVESISPAAFPYVDSGLPAGTAVAYYAEAVNDSPNQDTSNASAQTMATTQSAVTPTPTQPQIQAVAQSSSSISVALTTASVEPVNGIKDYVLSRSVASSPFNPLATLLPAQWPYLDTGLSPSTAYSYQTYAVDAGAVPTPSPTSATATATTLAAGSATPLDTYIATFPKSGKYLVGQCWYQLAGNDNTIWAQFLTKNGPVVSIPDSTAKSYPNVSILNAPNGGGTKTNTNLTPGIIHGFIPTKATNQNTTGTAITVAGAMNAINSVQNNGGIMLISWAPPSPVTDSYSGNGTEFPQVLQAGTTANNNLNSAIDNFCVQIKKLTKKHFLRIYQEINLNRATTFWYATGGVNTTVHPTNQDAINLWRYTYNRMVNTNGVDPTKSLFVYCCSLYNSGFANNDPGSQYYTYRGVDVYGGGSTTAAIASTMNNYGCQYYESFNEPWLLCECGVSSTSDPPTYSADSNQYGVGLQSYFPHLFASVFWTETWDLSQQNNAGALLNASETLGKLPVLS